MSAYVFRRNHVLKYYPKLAPEKVERLKNFFSLVEEAIDLQLIDQLTLAYKMMLTKKVENYMDYEDGTEPWPGGVTDPAHGTWRNPSPEHPLHKDPMIAAYFGRFKPLPSPPPQKVEESVMPDGQKCYVVNSFNLTTLDNVHHVECKEFADALYECSNYMVCTQFKALRIGFYNADTDQYYFVRLSDVSWLWKPKSEKSIRSQLAERLLKQNIESDVYLGDFVTTTENHDLGPGYIGIIEYNLPMLSTVLGGVRNPISLEEAIGGDRYVIRWYLPIRNKRVYEVWTSNKLLHNMKQSWQNVTIRKANAHTKHRCF